MVRAWLSNMLVRAWLSTALLVPALHGQGIPPTFSSDGMASMASLSGLVRNFPSLEAVPEARFTAEEQNRFTFTPATPLIQPPNTFSPFTTNNALPTLSNSFAPFPPPPTFTPTSPAQPARQSNTLFSLPTPSTPAFTAFSPPPPSLRTPLQSSSLPTPLTAQERQALIGHLDGRADPARNVLTSRQRLAVQQENSLRALGFSPFSRESDRQRFLTPVPQTAASASTLPQRSPQTLPFTNFLSRLPAVQESERQSIQGEPELAMFQLERLLIMPDRIAVPRQPFQRQSQRKSENDQISQERFPLRRPALTFIDVEGSEELSEDPRQRIRITPTSQPRVDPREQPRTTPPAPQERRRVRLRVNNGQSRTEQIMKPQVEREKEQERKRKEEIRLQILAEREVAARLELAKKMAIIKEEEKAKKKVQAEREEQARLEAQRKREEEARIQAKIEKEANDRRLAQIEREEEARRQMREQEEEARRMAEIKKKQDARQAELKRQEDMNRFEIERQVQLQETPRQSTIPASGSHPERLLNKLSPTDQAVFLEHFSVLSLAQQTYAYNQFLSTPPEIQQFAISQFLSLDPQVLIVSIQAEIDREAGLTSQSSQRSSPSTPQFQSRPAALQQFQGQRQQQLINQQQISQQLQVSQQQQQFSQRRQQQFSPPQRQFSPQQQQGFLLQQQAVSRRGVSERGRRADRSEEGPSTQERKAIQQQLKQQAEARKTLKMIINKQKEINRRHLMSQ